MTYANLTTPDLNETAIVAFHRLSARCPGDANAAVLEKCLHEYAARITMSPRDRALQRNRQEGVDLTRG